MTGDCHVRFCESRGVRFPPATRHYLRPAGLLMVAPLPRHSFRDAGRKDFTAAARDLSTIRGDHQRLYITE